MGGDGFPEALQGDGIGNGEMAGKKIISAVGLDGATARLAGGIEGFLKGGGIVVGAIAFGAIIADGKDIGRLGKGRGKAKEKYRQADDLSQDLHDGGGCRFGRSGTRNEITGWK